MWNNEAVLSLRPPKNAVSAERPYAIVVEPERTAAGLVEDATIVFLTGRECPLRCLMCDLWRNTLDGPTPRGAIAKQIDYALAQATLAPTPAPRHIKLYNSGNFFDPLAVPPEDYGEIAGRLTSFLTVIVENHPKFCGRRCGEFRRLLPGRLEVALGLETAHEPTLQKLNKQMTVDDFRRAAEGLRRQDIDVRVFLLLRPPFMSEAEGVDWALRSLEIAFDAGAHCCCIIPTRGGNGAMERLQQQQQFTPPSLASLETVLEAGVRMGRGRVFADLWDIERFYDCPRCGPARAERLLRINHSQQLEQPSPACDCGSVLP